MATVLIFFLHWNCRSLVDIMVKIIQLLTVFPFEVSVFSKQMPILDYYRYSKDMLHENQVWSVNFDF